MQIVTGGSSGIGEACVRCLHSHKCKVIIADLNIVLGQQLAAELSSNIHFIKTDVSDEESIKAMISKTMALFDSIHIVINSAGVAWSDFTASPKKVHSSKLFSDVFKINVLGTFNVCKFAAQLMMKQPSVDDTKEKGVIINVASILGLEGQKGTVAYAASKAAIIGMTLPMARDLGKYGIRVMTLAPGLIETPMSQEFWAIIIRSNLLRETWETERIS